MAKETIKSNEKIIGVLIKANGRKKVIKGNTYYKTINFLRRVFK